MARVKHAVSNLRRHKRMIKKAKGAWGKRSKIFRRAKETVNRGMVFATRDRKARKGDFRRLWITRIHAACGEQGIRYNQFMAGLKAADVRLDRKILADLAVTDPAAFQQIVEVAKQLSEKPAAA
ncbi:MAG: 50S ribosomal protein L20 [Candidatus Omnitrophica bacterium]|nr:50S ribosomal protein L20 [Candidatus Omnitrophota bacterium]